MNQPTQTHWHPVASQLPDADTVVLVHVPGADEPVWLGYWDGDEWRYADAMPVTQPVTHWCEMPQPPDAEV